MGPFLLHALTVSLACLLASPALIAQSSAKPTAKPSAKSVLDSAEFKKISKRLSQRRDQLQLAKKSGWVGEGVTGLVQLNPQSKPPARLEKKVKALVSLENRDRERMIQLLVSGSPEGKAQEKVIRRSLFESQLARDPAGVSYQDDKQVWSKKKKVP